MSDPPRVNVYTIPSHRSFADALAAGLIRRFGKDPLELARGRILLPNNRAVRAVTEAFVRESGNGLLLPRLIPVGDPEIGDRVGGTLGQSMLVELDRREPERARFVLAFASHLHLCQAFAPREAGGGARRHGMPGDLPLRDFYGIYAALARLAPELATPRDVRRDPRLMARVTDYAANCEAICGTPRTTELRSLIARALGEVSLAAGTG